MTHKHSFILASLAALTALPLAGCSPVKPSAGEADANTNSSADAAATSPDAAPALATVRVFDEMLNPRVGTKVLFSNPDGTQISVQTTDATGEASEVVPGDAIVTVATADQFDGQGPIEYALQQIHGVQPGDQVEFGPRKAEPDQAYLGDVQVSFQQEYAGADHYATGSECTNNPHPANQIPSQLMLTYAFNNDRCHGNSARRDLLAYAYGDANSTNLLAWTTFDDVQLSGASVVSGTWSTAWKSMTLSASSIPLSGGMELSLHQYKGGVDYTLAERSGADVAKGGSHTETRSLPMGFADRLQARVEAFGSGGADDVIAFVTSNLALSASSFTADFAALGYPSFTNTTVDMSSPLAPSIAWTETGAVPAAAQARIFVARWYDTNASVDYELQVMAPLATSSPMVSPTLPADFLIKPGTSDNAWPPASSATLVTLVAGMISLGDRDDWDDVRQNRGLAVFGDESLDPAAPVGSTSVVTGGGLLNMD